MKNDIMKKILSEQTIAGVRFKNGNYEFDFNNDFPDDIIKLAGHKSNIASFKNKIYWFGYEFNDDIPSKQKTDFIAYLKGIGEKSISDSMLRQLVEMSMAKLEEEIHYKDIDGVVYPLSGRSKLVTKIIRIVDEHLYNDVAGCSFEITKTAPTNIDFDFDKFERDYGDNFNYKMMVKHIEEEILPSIRKLDYFSLAHSVKPKYRPYIKNYLDFPNIETLEKYAGLQGKNILIIDDINTPESTLNEILRVVSKVNNNCNVFIYTLIYNRRLHD